jgi:amidase
MDRRGFLTGAAALGVAALAATEASRAAPGSDLVGAGISDLSARLKAGQDTAVSLIERYTARINALDKSGPRVNSVIELNPDAPRIAEELDRERKTKGPRGPLHGIPVLIKDNIDTADKMSTSAGSLALEGSHPKRDAFIAARLRAAGAVILGKTNLSEWANFRSEHSVSGWSGRGGQTRNPYALDRNPCGSSSGSGAATAASFCAAAVGTETNGSIVCPSSINGIVGIKPTVGLLSRSGIIPISHSQDTAGPMARTVRDAAILLGALAGTDERDAATRDASAKAAPDYTKFLDAAGLKGARLGIGRKFMRRSPAVDRLIEQSYDALKKQGAELIDLPDLSGHDAGDSSYTVLLYEFKADLNAYLDSLGPSAPAKSLTDLIAFNDKNRDREMPWFEQEIFHQAQSKGPLTEKTYLDALAKSKKAAGEDGIDKAVSKHRLDAVIAPTAGPSWLIDWVSGDNESGGCSTLAAVAGYPHITVPAGYVFGLPVGLSFFGTAWSEPTLLKLAYAFEQTTKLRREPEFLATVRF